MELNQLLKENKKLRQRSRNQDYFIADLLKELVDIRRERDEANENGGVGLVRDREHQIGGQTFFALQMALWEDKHGF